MKISGIYQIQSKIKPERIYIGSACNIHRRWIEHLARMKRGVHENPKLQRHYDKYGKSDLIFSILIGCEKDDLITTEQFFMDSKNPYFNIRRIANSNLGIKTHPHTKESKELMRKANLGKEPWNKGKKGVYSKETLAIMAEKKEGLTHSKEHNQNISKGNEGREKSNEARSNMSKARKGNMSETSKKGWITRKLKLKQVQNN